MANCTGQFHLNTKHLWHLHLEGWRCSQELSCYWQLTDTYLMSGAVCLITARLQNMLWIHVTTLASSLNESAHCCMVVYVPGTCRSAHCCVMVYVSGTCRSAPDSICCLSEYCVTKAKLSCEGASTPQDHNDIIPYRWTSLNYSQYFCLSAEPCPMSRSVIDCS